MTNTQTHRRGRHRVSYHGWLRFLAALLAFSLVAAACSSDDGSSSSADSSPATSDSTDNADSTANADSTDNADNVTTTSGDGPEEYTVALMLASSANTWLQGSKAYAEAAAEGTGIELVEFDGQFDPDLQLAQIQDVVSSGQYDGIIISSINGPGIVPDIEAAIDAGIEVVAMGQILGPDIYDVEPQVEGLAASVSPGYDVGGVRLANLLIDACEGIDPCRTVYIFGIKGIPIDDAIRTGFDATIADHPNIQIVAEGEGGYLGPDQGIAAIQDIMIAVPEFDAVVGADQGIRGIETVLAEEGLLDSVALIGLGGGAPALEAVADGRWYGTVMGTPGDEGRLSVEAMLAALRDGVHQGFVDPYADVPDNGQVTIDNVDKFEAQFEG